MLGSSVDLFSFDYLLAILFVLTILLVILLCLLCLASELICSGVHLTEWGLEREVSLAFEGLSGLLDAGEFSSQVTQSSSTRCCLEAHQLWFVPGFGVLSLNCCLLVWLVLETLVHKLMLSHLWKALNTSGVHIRQDATLHTWLKSKSHLVDSLSLIKLLRRSLALFWICRLLLLLGEVLHARCSILRHLVWERHECLALNLLLLVRILFLLCLVILAVISLSSIVSLVLLLLLSLSLRKLCKILRQRLVFFFPWLLLSRQDRRFHSLCKVRSKAHGHLLLLIEVDQVRELGVLLIQLGLIGLGALCSGCIDWQVEGRKGQLFVVESRRILTVLFSHARHGWRLGCARLLLDLSLSWC